MSCWIGSNICFNYIKHNSEKREINKVRIFVLENLENKEYKCIKLHVVNHLLYFIGKKLKRPSVYYYKVNCSNCRS